MEEDSPSQKNFFPKTPKTNGGKRVINLDESSSEDDIDAYLDPEEVFRRCCKKWLEKHKDELFNVWQETTEKLWEIRPKVQRKTKEK